MMSSIKQIYDCILRNEEYTINDCLRGEIYDQLLKEPDTNAWAKWLQILKDSKNSSELIDIIDFIKNRNYHVLNFPATDESDIVTDPLTHVLKEEMCINNIQMSIDQYRFFNSSNSLFAAPTSSGKSMIARMKIIEHLKKGDSCAMIVPLKSLITENKKRFEEEYGFGNYQIITSIVQTPNKKTLLYILTQERALKLLEGSLLNIKYAYIDEFQNIAAYSDSRNSSLTLLKDELIKKNIWVTYMGVGNEKLINAIEQIEEKTFLNKIVSKNTVTSPLFFVALKGEIIPAENYELSKYVKSKKMENNTAAPENYDHVVNILNFVKWSEKLIDRNRVMVYFESIDKMRNMGWLLYKEMEYIESPEINELIEYIKEEIGENYELIDFLKKGIAYHVAFLDEYTKITIERLFQTGILKILLCTSTLAQGVDFLINYLYIPGSKQIYGSNPKLKVLNIIGRASRFKKKNVGNVIIAAHSTEIAKLAAYYSDNDLIDDTTKKANVEFAEKLLNNDGLIAMVDVYNTYNLNPDILINSFSALLQRKQLSIKKRRNIEKFYDYLNNKVNYTNFSYSDLANGVLSNDKISIIFDRMSHVLEDFKFTDENTRLAISVVNEVYEMGWSDKQQNFFFKTFINHIRGRKLKPLIETLMIDDIYINSSYPEIYTDSIENKKDCIKVADNDICPKRLYSLKVVKKLKSVGQQIEFELSSKIFSLFEKTGKNSNDVKSVYETSLTWDLSNRWLSIGIIDRKVIMILNEISSISEEIIKILPNGISICESDLDVLFRHVPHKKNSYINILKEHNILK